MVKCLRRGATKTLRSPRLYEESGLAGNFPADGAARAWLFDRGQVRQSEISDTGDICLEVSMEEADWARFHARWPELAQ